MVNLSPATVIAWRAIITPKFFVRFFGYDGKDSATKHSGLVLKLQKSLEIIASHVGTSAATLRISPPSEPALPKGDPPSTFLVYGATQLLLRTVLDQRIWSVPQVSFETYPFESNVIPPIILCLAGYICPDDNTVVNTVKSAWLQPLAKTQLVEILLTFDSVSFSGAEAPKLAWAAIQKMIDSVRSELLDFRSPGGAPSPRWNIYVTSPTTRIAAWPKLQEYMYELTYPSILSGTGIPRSLFVCTLCHSSNHPRGLCPFPDIQGWNGPQHAERNNDSTTREFGRGRGRGWAGAGASAARPSERTRYPN